MARDVKTPNLASYWLLVRDGCSGVEVLTTSFSGEQRALPVFSFEEESEMFLCLRGSEKESQDGWRPREFVAGDLLTLFYTALEEVNCVTLDPIPENSFLNTSRLLSIRREDFLARLVRQKKTGTETATLRPLKQDPPRQRTL